MVSLADFVNSKFFVRLYFDLPSFLQGLLFDERNLKDANRGDVITLAKRDAGRESTILFISLSTSSSFSGLDAIAEERWISCGLRRITARPQKVSLYGNIYFRTTVHPQLS